MRAKIDVEFYSGPYLLSGQLDIPNTKNEKYKTVFFIPGAPKHDRYGNVKGYRGYNNYFEPIVKLMMELNFAVFRWDKGGSGKSSSGLSFESDILSAYKKLLSLKEIDNSNIIILAIGAGSGYVYRTWFELNRLNKIDKLILLATGINYKKIQDLNVPIYLICKLENILRSKNALFDYSNEKGIPTFYHGAEEVNEQLLSSANGVINMINDNDLEWSHEVLFILKNWFS
ncbi:MAG: hypothetical protein VXX61_02320 [Asgard group archaeon]|nr:hypothetical protein [Asgard group archaeon]